MAVSSQASGAIKIYVGLGTSKAPALLGTCEQAPDRQKRRAYTLVNNDLSGAEIPWDRMKAASEELATCIFTWFDDDVLLALELQQDSLAVGTLLLTEDQTFPVWYRRERRNVPAMTAVGMRPGERFPYTILGDSVVRDGNKQNSRQLTFIHMQKYDIKTGGFFLKDYNMSAVNSFV